MLIDGQNILVANGRSVVFLFPGVGGQYNGMGRGLWRDDLLYQEFFEQCVRIGAPYFPFDLREKLLNPVDCERVGSFRNSVELSGEIDWKALTRRETFDGERRDVYLDDIPLLHFSIFAVEYALARAVQARGVQPDAVMGQSLGEITAACVCGVYSLPDAVSLVIRRARLLERTEAGVMLAVQAPEHVITPLLPENTHIAVINGASLCLAAGASEGMNILGERLAGRRMTFIPVLNSHPLHTPLMNPIRKQLDRESALLVRRSAVIPMISNVNGGWIFAGNIIDAEYWGRHLVSPARIFDGFKTLFQVFCASSGERPFFIELGPGDTMGMLAVQNAAALEIQKPRVLFTLRNAADERINDKSFLDAQLEKLTRFGTNEKGRGTDSGDGRKFLTGLQGKIAAVWREILGVETILPSDNFFALGGGSIQAMYFGQRFHEVFGCIVPLSLLYQHPVLQELAEKIGVLGSLPGEGDAWGARESLPDMPLAEFPGDGCEFPLSFAQEQLWFLYCLNPGSAAYNVPFLVRIGGDLNVGALERAIRIIVRRHSALRTVFRSREGVPYQKVAPDMEWEIAFYNMELGVEEMKRRIQDLISVPFRLEDGPLFRVHFIISKGVPAYLLFVFHHITFDGLCKQTFWDELKKYYLAEREERIDEPPPAPVQYYHFVMMQRRRAARITEERMDFWRKTLEGAPPLLELPYDYPRSAHWNDQGAFYRFSFPETLVRKLDRHIRQEGVTLFRLLTALFHVFLSRYSGQSDICIGFPVSNRDDIRFRSVLGFFVNISVIRSKIEEEETFARFLARLSGSADEVMARRDTPFKWIADRFAPQRDPGINPIFQAMLLLHVGLTTSGDADGVLGIPEDIHNGTAKFDLTLETRRTAAGIDAGLEYRTDLFAPETIVAMSEHFLVLAEQCFDYPDQPLHCLEIVTEVEKQRLLREWNNKINPLPADVGLHHLVEARARKNPKRIAVYQTNPVPGEATYEHVEEYAEQLAKRLTALGLPGGVAVLVFSPGVSALIAMLAVLKCGACYLPVDPGFPAGRIDFILKDSEARVILTPGDYQADWLEKFSGSGMGGDDCGTLKYGNEGFAEVSAPPAYRLLVKRGGHCGGSGAESVLNPIGSSLAYIIYTSGSSGRPNGVAIPHRSIVNCLLALQTLLETGETEVVGALTTLAFDISLLENFLPLICGARVSYLPVEASRDGRLLADLLEQRQITLFQATPACWRLLEEAGWRGKNDLTAISGGDVLSPALAAWILSRVRRLYNGYGPTEATVYAGFFRVLEPGNNVPVGKPLDNTGFYVLDGRRRLVPEGVMGELYIGGAGAAPGYLNRPELTAERFSEWEGERLYRTGDRVRRRRDGNLEFHGRLTRQIKMRGFRVEPDEIEICLNTHPSVAETAVIPIYWGEGDVRLAAYVALTGEGASPCELERFLGERLPHYMIPGVFIFLDELPHTAGGKLDRRALPMPGEADVEYSAKGAEPPGDVELRLSELWAGVLKRRHVGLDERFFEAGGYSLLAMRLFAAIEKEFGVNLPVSAIFTAPTVRKLAETIKKGDEASHWASVTPLRTGGDKTPAYLMRYADGGVLDYHELAELWPEGYPLFGLQSRRTSAKFVPMRQIRRIAAEYIGEIKRFHRGGPCIVGGHSFGGRVAFETALGLQTLGIPVSMLILIDSRGPDCRFLPWSRRWPFVLSAYLQKVIFHGRRLWRMPREQRGDYIREKGRIWGGRVIQQAGRLRKHIHKRVFNVKTSPTPSETPRTSSFPDEAPLADVKKELFNGLTLLFKASAPLPVADRETYGWKKYIDGELRIFTVPGEHGNLTKRPSANLIANMIKQCLDEMEKQT